ncbi:hypothetical protein LIER_21286 [Lithospermum erythrorhizon]|uniref:Uncharacterized protein n=1 Tax=Lithospermum erythrorhizon TaxID=34254 RepID=A0AAV3QSV6_LITER
MPIEFVKCDDGSIVLDDSDSIPIHDSWGYCLVGCFTGRFPGGKAVYDIMIVVPHTRRWTIFKFKSYENREKKFGHAWDGCGELEELNKLVEDNATNAPTEEPIVRTVIPKGRAALGPIVKEAPPEINGLEPVSVHDVARDLVPILANNSGPGVPLEGAVFEKSLAIDGAVENTDLEHVLVQAVAPDLVPILANNSASSETLEGVDLERHLAIDGITLETGFTMETRDLEVNPGDHDIMARDDRIQGMNHHLVTIWKRGC